jgi:hypothetical protein
MKIPIGKYHELEDFGPSTGRSDFQTEYVMGIAQRSDFDFYCMDPMCDGQYKGPFRLMFYTKDGALHAHWVGVRKVLNTAVAAD